MFLNSCSLVLLGCLHSFILFLYLMDITILFHALVYLAYTLGALLCTYIAWILLYYFVHLYILDILRCFSLYLYLVDITLLFCALVYLGYNLVLFSVLISMDITVLFRALVYPRYTTVLCSVLISRGYYCTISCTCIISDFIN